MILNFHRGTVYDTVQILCIYNVEKLQLFESKCETVTQTLNCGCYH